jgi:hypothetical protein
MFSLPFLVLPVWYSACLGPSGSSPSRLRLCCLSLIPAAHSVFKTFSGTQPSKQSLSSDWWLWAVSCQLQSPAVVIREATHQFLRRACLSTAPLRARDSTKAAPLSPLAATLTKNTGEGTKRRKEGSRLAHVSIVTRRNPTYSLYFQRLRNNFVHNRGWGVSWRNPKPKEKNAGAERHRELDYVEWNPAFCIAVRASGFFMNVSQTRPLL